jgi:galactonate dehydratase
MLGDVPWRFDVVETDMKRESGYWLPIESPGLGIEVNEREAAKHPFAQETFQQSTFLEDGSVAEW